MPISQMNCGDVMLQNLRGLRNSFGSRKREWRLTDDVWAEFEYRGFPFRMESPFAYLWIVAASSEVSETVFREIETHVANYHRVGPITRWKAGWRYLRLRRVALTHVKRCGARLLWWCCS